ncbi:putative ABC transport system permease protein [Hamadaea flava]|uniref:FtsX-like permease family protein n=1 Tax=Hamadaea flava TaxID=1742688 RepID=A0ABV8LXR3_9ACTN|nr:FtsX-like permease family protein [Hamadaea flava]MCP2323491.1 putative ABC transport system permease protein [Hamadaea flava]
MRLIFRLVFRDLRRRPFDAVTVVLVIGVAVTALSVGLGLRGATENPYKQTRQAAAGPDAVISFLNVEDRDVDQATVDKLVRLPGVTGHSGPFPMVFTTMQANGRQMSVTAEGRATTATAIDQPYVTDGAWIGQGQAVIERGFAQAMGIRVGDQITLGGRAFQVAGLAVTAALPAYPSNICHIACNAPVEGPHGRGAPDVGLVWIDQPQVAALASSTNPRTYLLNLTLADPGNAEAWVESIRMDPATAGGPGLYPMAWQTIQDADNGLVQTEQVAMHVSAILLSLLAIAGMAVLAGRRMVDQTRRVGLLKAIGGTPNLVAGVLLAEHLLLALIAAALGAVIGRLLTPSIAGIGAGLVGSPGAPVLSPFNMLLPLFVAVAVTVAATALPALRAGSTSTVRALHDQPRTPRRRPLLVRFSAKLPVPLLLGLRLLARRPARGLLNTATVAITVTGIVAIFATAGVDLADGPVTRAQRLTDLTRIITVLLIIVAAVNVLFIAWATIVDARRTIALAQAFGATAGQIRAGITAAQLLPALLGTLLGVPLGLYLYRALAQQPTLTIPPAPQLAAIAAGTLLAVAVLTAVPLRIAGRGPVSVALASEHI